MKVNLEYLAKLLGVFLSAETAHISCNDLGEAGIQIESSQNPRMFDEDYLFHVQLCLENKLISNLHLESDTLKQIGIQFDGNGYPHLSVVPLRLTQKGHDFANALGNKEVISKLKSELKNAPFKAIFDGSQVLLQHILKKKIDSLID